MPPRWHCGSSDTWCQWGVTSKRLPDFNQAAALNPTRRWCVVSTVSSAVRDECSCVGCCS
jgi:hypothetical protein